MLVCLRLTESDYVSSFDPHQLLDEDEAAGQPICLVGIEGNRPVGGDGNRADLVELEPLGGGLFQRIDVGAMFQVGDSRGHHLAADL